MSGKETYFADSDKKVHFPNTSLLKSLERTVYFNYTETILPQEIIVIAHSHAYPPYNPAECNLKLKREGNKTPTSGENSYFSAFRARAREGQILKTFRRRRHFPKL